MNTDKLVNPVIMWSLVVAGIIAAFYFFPAEIILERTIWSWLTFFTSAFIWLYISIKALDIHKQATASVDAINYLVTGGIYNIIRHPLYVADIILAWGIFFIWPAVPILISVLWLTGILWLWMKLEERALLNKFGIEYRDYTKKVPMIFPNISRKKAKNEKYHN